MWKVLVIEDDPMLADIHKKYIDSQNDFECAGVLYDASKALDLLEKNHVDLILLDVYLPQMNGLDFLIKLRERQLGVDVILITAARNMEQIEKAFRYGAIDYLVKPFEFSRLDKAFDTYRSRKQAMETKVISGQKAIDSLFGAAMDEEALPKGLHEKTLERLKKAFDAFDDPVNIDELVEEMDMSKVTLRRYLDYLEKSSDIEIEMCYGSRGRPSYLYKKRTFKHK